MLEITLHAIVMPPSHAMTKNVKAGQTAVSNAPSTGGMAKGSE